MEVIEGGLLGYVAITEEEMAGASGRTENIDLCSEKAANAEPGDEKGKQKGSE